LKQLSVFSEGKTPSELLLKRKSYIQPFEAVLANAELKGLQGVPFSKTFFEHIAEDTIVLSPDIDQEELINRLAYWEAISTISDVFPTKQVLLELSGTRNFRGFDKTENLPKRRVLRYGAHDLHEYRGKFFPQMIKALINSVGLKKGAVVFDPTCGSGTTNYVARSMGMISIGVDLNPLSLFITKSKLSALEFTKSKLDKLYHRQRRLLKKPNTAFPPSKTWGNNDLGYLKRWFSEDALIDIANIRNILRENFSDHELIFLQVCLSNIIRTVSWQKISDLRVRKEKTAYIPRSAFTFFTQEVEKQYKKLNNYLEITEQDLPFEKFYLYEGNAVNLENMREWYGKCDILITSPPYATALPYLDTDRLSLIILNLLKRKDHRLREYDMIGNREISEKQRLTLWENFQNRKRELPENVVHLVENIAKHNHSGGVGFRRKNLPALLGKYFLDMLDSMSNAINFMKQGAHAFYIVGNNSTTVNGEKIVIPTDTFLWSIGEKAGWEKVALLDMELLPSRDIFKNNTGTSEKILAFKKSK